MQLPIVQPAPIVIEHAGAFRDLFENHCQFDHFQNYLTGLMVLENKSLSNISQCVLESADKTNLSRFLSQAPWSEREVNRRRVEYRNQQTQKHQRGAADSCLIIDDTVCEHVGTLFEFVDRHDDPSENRYPLAHNLVTRHFVSGAVRFPIDARIYRRYEEKTQWETFVKKHFPDRSIPKEAKARKRFHQEVDPLLLKDEEFAKLDAQFQTKIVLAVELIKEAIAGQVAFETVLMDSWFLAPDILELLRQLNLHWVSLLKKNRNLETHRFILKDAQGKPMTLKAPHIKVQDLVPLIPKTAFRKAQIGETAYWYFALHLRIPEMGKVRLVISFNTPDLTGTYAVLVSDRTDWSAKKIIQTYLQRWPIETFYQDSQGPLGLDEYRMRTAEAFQKHWGLVFVAYSFLHLDCLPASPMKSRSLTHPIHTIGQVCRRQGQLLIQKLILLAHELLLNGVAAKEVFAQFFQKQSLGLLTS